MMTDIERFLSPEPPPSARERELAELLIEEGGEIIIEVGHMIQRATKLLRFGVREIQPGQPDDNRRRLGMEIGDLLEVLEIAENEGLIDYEDVKAGRARKRRQLAKFMQTEASP